MMISGRPVSSPGRVENYPPPLMRFIRSKSSGGSRSRGRSRASPMFPRQKKSFGGGAAVDIQEPSSPKVTCMGQVRVTRSNQTGSRTRSAGNPRSRCGWLRNALNCCRFAGKHGTASSRGLRWSNCFSFSSCRSRRKAKGETDFSRSRPINPESSRENEGGNHGESPNSSWKRVSSPPRNALLLTRSRSAPYRSSSLAYKFWESESQSPPLEQEEAAKPGITDESQREADEETPKPIWRDSDRESIIIDSKTDTKFEFACEIESSMKENDPKFEKKEEARREESELGFMRPSILFRCKSLPARTGEMLDPEIGLWEKKIWFYD